MNLAIMQPYLFPYIGYWQLINSVDTFIIYDDVNYMKGGWINRNNILLAGVPHYVTLSLNQSSPNKKINQTEVLDTVANKRKFLGAIESAYNKAPQYKTVFPIIQECINYSENNLALYLEHHLKRVSDFLGIKTRIIMSSSIHKNNELTAQDKVIEICKKMNANVYINAIGGQELYSHEDFKKFDIDLKFIKTRPISYQQFRGDFVPYLSIIDIMMFNEPAAIQEFLNAYDLI